MAECTGGKYTECVPDSSDWMREMVSGLFNYLDANPERLSAVIAGLKQESE